MISAKTREYVALATQHKRSPHPDRLIKLEQARTALNICLTTKAEKHLRWTNRKFFTWWDRPGSLLARKHTPKHSHVALPKIRLSSGNLSQYPHKVLQEFQDFYTKLYNPSKGHIPVSINNFLHILSLPSLTESHRELLDQPIT